MVGTIMIHGSRGKVLAPVGGSRLIEGERRDIRIIAESDDEDLPRSVRRELVGITTTTIFSSGQVKGAAPEGSRVAYVSEVAEALVNAGKPSAAEDLLEAMKLKNDGSEYHFLIFKAGEFEFIN